MSGIQNIVSEYIPFLRKKPSLTRDQALRTRPVQNPLLEWEKADTGDITLKIPRRKDLTARILSRIFQAPGHKEIVLDQVGSYIWEMCDGKHSVESIVMATSREYKLTRRECETSVAMYLKMLGDRKLVGFRVGGSRKK